jgi:hypothetical protein
MSGPRHRRKGNRIERELVQLHKALGIHAERYPLSGASRFRGSGHDLDLYIFGADEAPLIAESKARRSGGGFTTIERWLSEYDVLFLRRNHADPLVVAPWRALGRACLSGFSDETTVPANAAVAGAVLMIGGTAKERKIEKCRIPMRLKN